MRHRSTLIVGLRRLLQGATLSSSNSATICFLRPFTASASVVDELIQNPQQAAALLLKASPFEIPAAARAIAKAQLKGADLVEPLVTAAIRAVSSHQLDAAALLDLLDGLQNLGCYSIEFKDALADALIARLHDLTGSQIAQFLRLFSESGYIDDELFETTAKHLAENTYKFTPHDVADVVWSFSRTASCLPDLVLAVENIATRLLQEENGHPAHIASLLDAYARLGCSADAVDDLIDACAKTPDTFDPQSLAKVIIACFRLGYGDAGTVTPFVEAMTQRLSEEPHSVPPRSIVKMVKLMSEAGFLDAKLLDVITDTVVPSSIHQYTQDQLDDLVRALNGLCYNCPSLRKVQSSTTSA